MKRPTAADRRVAYHEAGHAAVARRLGIGLRSVTIVADGDSLGSTYHRGAGPSFRPDIEIDGRTRNRLEGQMMLALAGGEAEHVFLGRTGKNGLGQDYDSAVRLALYMAGDEDEASAYLEWMRLRTRNMLRTPPVRMEVEAIASALLDRRHLRAAEIRAVCEAAWARVLEERRAEREAAR